MLHALKRYNAQLQRESPRKFQNELPRKAQPQRESPRKSHPQRESQKESCSQSHFSSANLLNNHTKSELQDAVAHIDKLYNAIKILTLMLFPEKYMKAHSISGKPSNNKQAAKPPLDARLYRILVEIIKDKYETSTKEITAKVHSVRKWVQKRRLVNGRFCCLHYSKGKRVNIRVL